MEIRLKVNLVTDLGEPFLGAAPLKLLERIGKYGFTNKAAKEMKLSYVTALKMLNRLERNLGQDLFVRKRGGMQEFGSFVKRREEIRTHG